MSSRIFVMPETLDWKQAYMAAILEKDRTRMMALIMHAREKLSARLRELTTRRPMLCDEVEAIHDAIYMLHALESSLSYRDERDAQDPSRQEN